MGGCRGREGGLGEACTHPSRRKRWTASAYAPVACTGSVPIDGWPSTMPGKVELSAPAGIEIDALHHHAGGGAVAVRDHHRIDREGIDPDHPGQPHYIL